MHSRTRPANAATARALALLLLPALAGCGLCLRGSGNVQSEDRTVGPFHSFEIDGSADVVAVASGTLEGGDLRVTTDDNLLAHVTTRVTRGKLVIDTGHRVCLDPSGPLTVTTSLEGLRALSIDGSGNVRSELPIEGETLRIVIDGSGSVRLTSVDVEELSVSIDGSGDVELGGRAARLALTIDGSGDIDAFGLAAEDCEVEIDGSGDVGVVVTQHLDVVIDGSGDVTYHGKPEKLTTRIEGSGDVVAR